MGRRPLSDEEIANLIWRMRDEADAHDAETAFGQNSLRVARDGLDRLGMSVAFEALRDAVQPSIDEALIRAQAKARRSDRDDDDTR